MKANKRDWLHFITGAVAAVIVSAAVHDAANVTPVPEPIRKCCCCCCCKVNTDEVIYTLEVEAETQTFPVGEPPANAVILSK
mgnify:FL=1|jgi:hypothetical protein